MRIMLFFLIAALFVSPAVFATDFSPSILTLSAQDLIQYDFDGNELSIPVSVTGAACLSIFFVYTKDMADNIVDIHNGYLGWHYVNKIDTCVYFSQEKPLDIGTGTISWDGNDADGNMVPAGEYTYYIWAYDNTNLKEKVMFGDGAFRPSAHTHILETDEEGLPLDKPIFHTSTSKWAIGNDPLDMLFIETTTYDIPDGWGREGGIAFHPTDNSIVYMMMDNKETNTQQVLKYQWVPNGEAVLDTEWGEDLVFTNPHYAGSGPNTDGETIWTTYYSQYENGSNTNLYVIDFDGTLIQVWDNSDWFTRMDDYDAGAQSAGGPSDMEVRGGVAHVQHRHACIKGMLNPNAEDEDDYFVWINQNGDYVNDHNSEPDAGKPWVCIDFNVGPYAYSITTDKNHFTVLPSYDMGAVSFSLMGPDGTGVAYYAFAGETANIKRGIEICDNDGPRDGIYTDNNSSTVEDEQGGTWFVAQDSFMGTITSSPVSVDDNPEAVSIAQNVPNPFNPSTTINYTTAEAENVTIDVFNVAGQKVDTIVNEFMQPGSHSAAWDASEFSAGVYFYTVKAGEYSKTMKMTLIK